MLRIPENEFERIGAVRRYDVLDSPPDGAFDRITLLASRLFNVPIALVTIVDTDRIWFKSRHGLDAVGEIPREPGLCASAICQAEPYIIEHARKDPRSFANPLVAGEFGLQFYAAAPLKTSDGFNLGTFCLLDRKPRSFSKSDAETLQALAEIVVDELELRLEALKTIASERGLRAESQRLAVENERLYRQEQRVASTLQTAMLPQSFPHVASMEFDALYAPAESDGFLGGDWYDAFMLDENHLLLSIGDVAGHGLPAAALMGKIRQSLRAIALNVASPREILLRLDRVLRTEGPELIVTAFVAIVDIATRRLDYANAGHPPPLLRTAAGEVSELPRVGLPLGLRSEFEPEDAWLDIKSGSILALYTDGLTEAKRNILEGERSLREAFLLPDVALADRPAAAIKQALGIESAPDDIAIMTVRFRG